MQKERGVEWRGIVRESHPVSPWQGGSRAGERRVAGRLRGLALGSRLVQGHGGANERLQRLLVYLLALVEVDGTPRVSVKTGVEEARRILQSRAFGEGHLHDGLVGLACADQSVVRPHRNPSPLPLFDDFGIGFFDQGAQPAEHLAPPVAELLDSRVDQLRRRLAFLRPALLHARFSSKWGASPPCRFKHETKRAAKARTANLPSRDDAGENVIEHLAGVEDFEAAETTYRAVKKPVMLRDRQD